MTRDPDAKEGHTPETDAAELDSSHFTDWGHGPSGYVPRSDMAKLESDRTHLRERVKELEKDATRYRFIRNLVAIEDIERLMADGNPTPDEHESLMTDAAIDAALSKSPK